MARTLSAVLDDARRRGFVGRSAQLQTFDAALSAGQQPGLDVFLPEDPSLGAQYVAGALERAVRAPGASG